MGFQQPVAEALPRYPVIIGESLEEQGTGEMLAHVYRRRARRPSGMARSVRRQAP